MKKNKEILFISNFFGNGGAARVISLLSEEFAKQGYDVSICSFSNNNFRNYNTPLNVNHYKINRKCTNKMLYRLERIYKLRREIKKHKGATIISFEYFLNMQTIIAKFGLNNRIIISERNDPSNVGGRGFMKFLRDFLYKFPDKLVFQTPDAMGYFSDKIQKKSIVIPNPIKSDLPSPWNEKRENKVVNFCRLEKQKNLNLLIDSFEEFHKIHSEYTLSIYGDGKEEKSLKNYIKSKNMDNIVSLNPSINDIHEEIKKSMMFVSTSNYEGLSNSMIEAMGIGLPTICTDCPCGGAKMVIDNKINGLLVPVGDKDEIVKAMNLVADNKDFRDLISFNGSLIKEKLDLGNIVNKWEKLLF